ncbi:MFS transporter [Saccharopolyspora spinosa]|uniref:Putative proline/betaine transporter n=1 Tax=Saccharopolyspora spinosa TaxID=60894 RepID=A0A2N3Y137_SACSN|nr:MFS transporter [Saccharopolyspora spinosa]PKW16629.1 MHS family proline/betaine transporter-like MFS transporter [Saccharopolyspora spinosa]
MSTKTSRAREANRSRVRALLTGVSGTFVEYYDFAVYGLVAPVIATQFFPTGDSLSALLATFGIFAIGFVGRPLGGIVFGHFGDKVGRRNVLSVAIIMMTACTVLVGLLPAYSTIGIAAPLLLLALRLIQNFSVGGEFSGASAFVVEHAPPERRGVHGASINISSVFPFVAAIALVLPFSAILSDTQFAAWGWRIPFLLAGPLGIIGLYLRLKVEETPAYQQAKQQGNLERLPVVTALRTQYRRILLLFVSAAVSGISFYMLSSYMVTHLTKELGFGRTPALLINAAAVLAFCVAGLVYARISDKIGRKPVTLVSHAAVVILAVPSFVLMAVGNVFTATIGQCLFAISLAGLSVMTTVISVELFPPQVRYSSNALGYQGAYMIFAGTAPFLSTWLVGITGSSLAPAVYVSTAALISFCVLAALLPETRSAPLSEMTPAAKGVLDPTPPTAA